MNKEKLKKYEKLVDDICSDDSGADMPYDNFVKKWALEIYSMMLDEQKEWQEKTLKELKK